MALHIQAVKITAVICTHNRAAYLPGAIESLLDQSLPTSYYEILVIDNCSTDDTPAIVQRYLAAAGDVTLRSARAEPLGLSHARNLAVQMAAGEIIAFLDDDGIADPDWLAALLATYSDFPDVWAVGGKVLPAWEGERPSWLTDTLLPQLSMLDLGDTPHPLEKGEELFGTNCSFRRCAFDQLGLFRTDLGRSGYQMLGSEETEFQIRILRQGKIVIYTPNAVVHHWVTSEHMQPRYFIALAYGKGRTRARVLPADYQFSTLCWQIVRGGLGVARQWLRLCLNPLDRARQVQCMRITAGWLGFIIEAAWST